jgi:hypothetical protein
MVKLGFAGMASPVVRTGSRACCARRVRSAMVKLGFAGMASPVVRMGSKACCARRVRSAMARLGIGSAVRPELVRLGEGSAASRGTSGSFGNLCELGFVWVRRGTGCGDPVRSGWDERTPPHLR